MNRTLLTAIVCIALSMLTTTSAFAASPLCRPVKHLFHRLCKNNNLFCDRMDVALQAVCGQVNTVYVAASAEGRVINILRKDFDVVPLEDGTPTPFFLGPVVVTAAELDDPDIAKLLTEVYAAGRTVAIAFATVEEANRFTRFFGAGDIASCTANDDGSLIALYGLQKSLTRRPAQNASYCLKGLGDPDKKRDKLVRLWLLERFALSPPEPAPGDAPDSNVNLQDLSSQTHCSFLDTNDPDNLGRQMQLDSYVLSVRSFDNAQDLYLVNNELQFEQGSFQGPTYAFEVQRFGATGMQNIAATVDFTEPASQNVTVSYTNSESTTVSGSVGFNETQGFNASVSTSVTVGTSSTVNVPPVLITNQTSLSPPFPKWTFKPTDTSATNVLFSAQANWVWTVDQSAYGADGGEGTTGTVSFVSAIAIDDFVAQPVCATAPYPFPEWAVSAPQIANVNPTSASNNGGTFTISGAQLYPGLVTAVLLGGDALPMTNYVTKSDTAIQVIVPNTVPTGKHPVEVETTFGGQTLPSNTDVTVDITK